ncbi:MAG: HAMP domain-containing histidine kinase [Gemmatimonadales bacterium]|nr:MAG: HAMP domain-containing histidine kinase [Gemmatimonadales bacterium]
MTLRLRLLILGGGVIAAAFLLVGLGLRGAAEAPWAEAREDQVLRSWATAARLLEVDGALGADPRQGALELGDLLGMRVTLVDPTGQVLGDSGVPEGDVDNMENHAGRPEVRAALEGRLELVERRSPTQGVLSFYVAGPATLPGGEPVVLRLATPRGVAGGPLERAPVLLLLVGAGAFLVLAAVTVGGGMDGQLRRSIRRLEGAAAMAGSGKLDGFPPPEDLSSELAGLGSSLQRMGDEVRDRMRELLREREELLTLVDAIAEGVVALTDDARVLRMNRAAVELLEVPRPAPFAPIGTLIRHPYLRDHLEESVVLPLPPREFQVGDRHLLIAAHLLPEGGSVVTFLDVTDLRRMEKIRRDFVANASHEMKTPLTAMRGFAETLLDGDPPEELRREFLASIRTNSVRLQNLVDDLLDLSRLEAGAWPVQEEEVELADSAFEVWEELMQARGAPAPEFQIHGDAVGLADAQALHLVFRNLLDNALRFTPDDGNVEVRITPRGPEVEVAVTDSGAGIPSTALPRIFERFYRVDPGRDRAAGGTGLGLAIVRHLVQSMGGEVSAESQLGEGTTIRFTLPRVEVT